MSLPVYFVPGPDAPHPALCGWYCGTDGSLMEPPGTERTEALLFDDRNVLPQDFEPLISALLHAQQARQAQVLVLDFERPPTAIACRFVAEIAKRCRTAAPDGFCGNSSAEPIFCYSPEKETFQEFCHHIPAGNGWLELRPVEKTVHYPAQISVPSPASEARFSDVLQCHYRLREASDGYYLQLFDTPESFQKRYALLSPQLKAAIGLKAELDAFSFAG